MADDDKKLPKKFDTTSRLNLEDTFDEDEVTLVDELVEPNSVPEKKRREESVTERLPNTKAKIVKAKVAEAKVAKTIKEIPVVQKIRKPPIKLSPQAKKYVFMAVVAVPILVGLIFLSNLAMTCQKKKSLIAVDPTKALSRTIPLELSKVEFVDLNGEKIDDKNIPVNTYFTMRFNLLSWDARADEKLDLKADIRIYSQKNQLLVFQPEYAKFSQSADVKKDKMLIQTKLRFSNKSELGFYRVFITVKENTTQRQNSVQSRIRVVRNK